MTRLAIATVLLALFLPAVASANTPDENWDLAVASAYWGTEASCPAASITVKHDLPLEDKAYGRAFQGGCFTNYLDGHTIHLRQDDPLAIGTAGWCQIIVHEYGHLIGNIHDIGVMLEWALDGPLVSGCAIKTAAVEPTHYKPNRCKSRSYKRNHPNKCRRS